MRRLGNGPREKEEGVVQQLDCLIISLDRAVFLVTGWHKSPAISKEP